MKLFTKQQQDTFTVLDELMVRMASDEIYDEYIMIRGKMCNAHSL